MKYTPPVNHRCLRIPTPLCGRIKKLFEDIPINITSISNYSLNLILISICNPCPHNTSISYHNSKTSIPLFNAPRNLQIILTRLYPRVTKITHYHIIAKESSPLCQTCGDDLTLDHIFIDCPSFTSARTKITSYCHSKDLIFNLNTILSKEFPTQILLGFIQEIHFSSKI